MISRREFFVSFVSAAALAQGAKQRAAPLPSGVQTFIAQVPLAPLEGAVSIANQMGSLGTLIQAHLANPNLSETEIKKAIATEVGDRCGTFMMWINSMLLKPWTDRLPLAEASKFNLWMTAHTGLIAYNNTHISLLMREAMFDKLTGMELAAFKSDIWAPIWQTMLRLHTEELLQFYHPKQLASLPQDVKTFPRALMTRRFLLANTALLAQHSLPFSGNAALAGNTGVSRLAALTHRQIVVGAKQVGEASPSFKEAVREKAAVNWASYMVEGLVNTGLQAVLSTPAFKGMFSHDKARGNAQAIVGLLGGIAARKKLGDPIQTWLLSNSSAAKTALKRLKSLVAPLPSNRK
jgi:hypothetical protein